MDGCSCCLSMTRLTPGNCCVSCCATPVWRTADIVDSVAAAYRVIQAEPPDLVFTDWQMPGESGLDLIRYIRERPDSPDPLLPVILLTANGDAEHVLRARKAGADGLSGQAVLPEPHCRSSDSCRSPSSGRSSSPPSTRAPIGDGSGTRATAKAKVRSVAARCHRAAAGWSVAGEGPWRAGGHSRRPATPCRGDRRRQELRQPNTRRYSGPPSPPPQGSGRSWTEHQDR